MFRKNKYNILSNVNIINLETKPFIPNGIEVSILKDQADTLDSAITWFTISPFKTRGKSV